MKYKIGKDFIEIVGKEDFNIEHTLECGQVFSYEKKENYFVYSADKMAEVIENKNGFLIKTNDTTYFENYFDLKTDYAKIKKHLSNYDILREPVRYGYGIRILRQDLFETLISFIVSANNNIKRIKAILFKLRQMCGTKKDGFYAFPTREQLLRVSEEDLKGIGAGYRAKYIYEVVRQIDDKTLHKWKDLDTPALRKQLMTLMGVGPKVADCIMLFGYGRGDVFPVDTWIHQMYEKYYSECKNREKIRQNLTKEFGLMSGYAQQYLFYFMRADENEKNS